ncbi:hypothetical protein Zmor_007357 [Zophobas morio]|uniref:Transposase n=1 Tax=Zophobas morio TaxID=2755281 RepID=A0AA38IWH5_9CUCU|nr:hypothetical protein Zmor_007357 [Zophobas morio]
MAVIGSKECCKLKNKFWNASKKSPTSPLAEVGVPQFIVHRTLKEQGQHPYHVQKVQALEPEQNCILFTDEAGFTRNLVR